ncbi:glutamate racemase [Desulfuribacillus stibiiarsenatis]|uniref:Glutamate racemase n=1 Tax=Desulfuribacillus stibiiarsenatis TaxID=1390249 RepID=A0A1E5L2A2_9FIRM|nr:glutamate racemase [Desulfuribacillus stibiiarsenatis]OEH84171.1 glutamate racemase [Desulfuribacillus stibiiarsenatis]
MSTKPIGVLDSGVGGLTVVKELMRQLPRESIVYYGDTAHCPYGIRDLAQVREFTFRIIEYLIEQDVKMIVIACNTATAASMSEARQRFNIPIIGVIQPGVRAAISATRNNRIGVIGTEGTINSNIYQNMLLKINPSMFVASQACQPFVSLVEQNLVYTKDARRLIAEYMEPIKVQHVDTLILGCTHYPLMANAISMVMGPEVELISSAEETARETIAVLYQHHLLNWSDDPATHIPTHKFYVSGHTRPFSEMGSRWLNRTILAEQVTLGVR